jgi:hypothetical protein
MRTQKRSHQWQTADGRRQKAESRKLKAEKSRVIFAVCRLPFAVCRLPSAVCRLPSAFPWHMLCRNIDTLAMLSYSLTIFTRTKPGRKGAYFSPHTPSF